MTRTTLAKTMLREDTGPKMVVSDFDAFIHLCTRRGTQNFVNIDPMSASKSPRSRTRHKTWAKVTKNNGWLTHHQDHRTKTPKKRKCHFKDPPTIDYGVTTKSQVCTSWPCIQKGKIAASFHGQCLVAYLVRCGQTWKGGTSGIVSSHGLIGSVSEHA